MPSISRVLSKGYPTHKKERLSDETGMGYSTGKTHT